MSRRADRLYSIAERLRAAAPRLVTVAALAAEHEVSERTVQRDLQALMAAGVPVRYQEGRGGGWTVDAAMTLPPINLTAEEAAALLLASAAARHQAPLGAATDRAMTKILAAVSASTADSVQSLGHRLHVMTGPGPDPAALTAVERAVRNWRALELGYVDALGAASHRVVEPVGLLTSAGRWYLIGWCRSRNGLRGFRLDRIRTAHELDQPAPHRDLHALLALEPVRQSPTG
jgi:predicted DNA-binding transcriptional regulator YafY